MENVKISMEEKIFGALGLNEDVVDKRRLEQYKTILREEKKIYEYFEDTLKKDENKFREITTRFREELLHQEDEYKSRMSEVISLDVVISGKEEYFRKRILISTFIKSLKDSDSLEKIYKTLNEELSKIRNNRIASFDNNDLRTVSDMLEKVLNSDEVIKMTSSVFSNPNSFGLHSKLNTQGAYMIAPIEKMLLIQKLLADYVIIHRDTSNISEFINLMEKEVSQVNDFYKMSNDEIEKKAVRFHIKYIRSKYPDISDKDIYDLIYNNYEKNGLLFQGINGIFNKSAKDVGLSTSFSGDGNDKIKIINELFEAHGVKNVFLSKIHESKFGKYYYLTDDFFMAYYFSFHNPEYLTMLLSRGAYMGDDRKFDTLAFYKRDFEACLDNVKKLCETYSFDKSEKEEVISIVQQSLNELTSNQDMSKNGIIITPKNIIPKSIKPSNFNGDLSLEENLYGLLAGRNIHENYKCYIDVPPEGVRVIEVPAFQNYLSLMKDKKDMKKMILCRDKYGNATPFLYDIYIKSTDKVDFDCITVENKPFTSIEKQNSIDGLNVDIIRCGDDLKPLDILKNENHHRVQPSFQSIMMMIAVNGVSNSQKGEELLNYARANFTPENMCQYYAFLSKKFLEMCEDSNFSNITRIYLMKRIISDVLPKAIYMNKTNRYPTDLNYDNLLLTQYDFGEQLQDLEIIKNFEKARKTNTLSDKKVSSFFSKSGKHYKGLVDEIFNDNYFDMCTHWYEQCGFETEIKKFDKLIKDQLKIK